jgi:MFS-type transporter involved in bile tolerance (Atg22 family)
MPEGLNEAETAAPNDLEIAKIHHRAHLWELLISGATTILSILSFAVPLYVVYLIVGVLAGKSTQVSSSVAYMVAAMVGGSSALAVAAGGWAKYNAQRKELVRLRERCEVLESRLRKRGARK